MTATVEVNINTTAFARLRWSIFDDMSDVQVMDDPNSLTTTLSSFSDHPIAKEHATNVPQGEIQFNAQTMMEFEGLDFEEPDELVVTRADGETVTVGDVVTQLHSYFNLHKATILECLAPIYNAGRSTEEGGNLTVIKEGRSIYDPIP